LPLEFKYGLPCKPGYADNICTHIEHGPQVNRRYNAITKMISGKITCLDDIITYDKSKCTILPSWNQSNDVANAISKAL